MARIELFKRLNESVLILDGAMGTQLMAAGVEPGCCNDYLNIEAPQTIAAVHTAYLRAGSDAIVTNTFGANKYVLGRHGYEKDVEQINLAGAKIGRDAAGDDKYVLGDIGPCGDFLEPLGGVKADELLAAFAVQARSLAEGGVDGFIIETMTAVDEIVIAVKAVKSVCDLPIFVSLAYDPAGGQFKTMMGIGPAAAVEQLSSLGITAIGFNCGTLSMDQYVELTGLYVEAIAQSPIALLAEPNAGKPELQGDQAVYTLSPEDFGDTARQICDAGAKIIGGCCGTGPEHIRKTVERLKE